MAYLNQGNLMGGPRPHEREVLAEVQCILVDNRKCRTGQGHPNDRDDADDHVGMVEGVTGEG